MLKNGSAEYYEIFTQDTLWAFLQRIRHGYLPHLKRMHIEGDDYSWVIEWRLGND